MTTLTVDWENKTVCIKHNTHILELGLCAKIETPYRHARSFGIKKRVMKQFKYVTVGFYFFDIVYSKLKPSRSL
jgi:hypothetical protein